MRWPLRSQILLPVVVLLLGIAASSAGTAYAAARVAHRQIEDRLRAVARFLAEDSRFPLTGDVLRQLGPLSGARYLLTRGGTVLHSSLPAAPGPLPATVPVADDWRSLSLGGAVRVDAEPYLCGAIRLRRGENAGDVLAIFYPESLWREARWEAILPSLVLGGLMGLVALALAAVQARSLSRRVGELEKQSRRIADGDFGPMPLPARDDEMRDLAGSVNDMAARLLQLQDAIRRTERLRLLGQVSGGLAHELRNGLTGARLAVQLHLHESGATPAEDDPLAVALRQLSLLETQVQRLLGLGKAGPPARQPHDLAALVGEAAGLLRPRCRHAGIALECGLPGPLLASVDAGQIGQMASNLLGNAIDAAGPGGAVEARLSQQGDMAILEVRDTGPGPGAAMAERLFEPFATSKPEGVGLGLAVARTIAEGHGGTIAWTREDGRTLFRVVLPLG